MKILLNCTTLVIGGGIQVAAEICNQASRDKSNEWVAVISPQLEQALEGRSIKMPNCVVVKPSPSRNRSSRKRLLELERQIAPDCVFTVFGPPYVSFRNPHLCGVADGWVTHADGDAYRGLNRPIQLLRMVMMTRLKGRAFRQADAWVVEADVAKRGLVERFDFDPNKIYVVSNNCAEHYFSRSKHVPPRKGSPIRLLTFASAYKHKNLDLIPEVARELEQIRPNLDFQFVTTVNNSSIVAKAFLDKAKRLGVERRINNVGPVPVSDGPELYDSCHICFMPSLLETFSATYPEAMAMGIPIVTSDLDFAHDICGDAALYFPPRDPRLAANQILKCIDDPERVKRLTAVGRERLASFPSPSEKFEQYVALLSQLTKEHRR